MQLAADTKQEVWRSGSWMRLVWFSQGDDDLAGGGERAARPGRLVGVLFVVAALVATIVLDHWTGPGYSVLPLYTLPIVWASWQFGFMTGLLVAGAAAAVWSILNADGSSGAAIWNGIARFAAFGLIAYLVAVHRVLVWSLRQVRHLAQTDDLTNVLNVRAFEKAAQREVERCRRVGAPLSLAFLDLDRFKEVNDNQGHAAGDRVLAAAARALADSIRLTDVLARVGGDEFVVLFPASDAVDAQRAAQRLLDGLNSAMARHDWPVTASIGLVTWRCPPPATDILVRKADAVMYVAKRGGGNCVHHEVICGAEAASRPDPSSSSTPAATLEKPPKITCAG